MTIPQDVRQKVDSLLGMYEKYKNCAKKQEDAASRLAKARLGDKPTRELEIEYAHPAQKLQSISDEMTFADPHVWALYKFEAYADEAQPIRTMQDFRVHCSKPGYICTKRFVFVNRALRQLKYVPLDDADAYPDAAPLSGAFETLYTLTQNESFMEAWESYEYYKPHGVTAKWDNFTE